MKKIRLIVSTLCLTLALTFSSVQPMHVYADGDDPQGTSETKKAPPPPSPTEEAAMALLMLIIRILT